MVKCPRCGHNLDDLQIITPDFVTKELMDSIDHGEETLTEEGFMKDCAECIDELKED